MQSHVPVHADGHGTDTYMCVPCLCLPPCSKSELLVVLKQPEGFDGPTHISFITDNANHLVLHWGTCKPGEHQGGGEREGTKGMHVRGPVGCQMCGGGGQQCGGGGGGEEGGGARQVE